jgi:hypothetical protein
MKDAVPFVRWTDRWGTLWEHRSGGIALVWNGDPAEDDDGLSKVVRGHVRERLLDRRGRVGQVRPGQLAEPREVGAYVSGPGSAESGGCARDVPGGVIG